MFPRSLKELKSVRCLTVTAMLIALDIAIKIVTIPVPALGSNMKISFAFLALASVGMLYGPVVGAIAGVVCDLVGYFATTQSFGAFDIRFTLVELLAGFIYGMCFYNIKFNKTFIPRVILSKVIVIIVCNLFLTTYFVYTVSSATSEGFWAMIPPKILKNLVQLPVDVFLLCVVLPIVKKAYISTFGKSKYYDAGTSDYPNELFKSYKGFRAVMLIVALTLIGLAVSITYGVALNERYTTHVSNQKKTLAAYDEQLDEIKAQLAQINEKLGITADEADE